MAEAKKAPARKAPARKAAEPQVHVEAVTITSGSKKYGTPNDMGEKATLRDRR